MTHAVVGVVTPVYNGQRHLAECIESVLGQTYPHWNYVIVDNRSTDGTVDVAASYARKDSRVKVVRHDSFVGVIENHNRALGYLPAQAAYCKFVHADDWLFPECLAEMVDLAETHPSVGVVSAYRLDDTKINLDGLPFPSTVVPGHEIARATLLGKLYVFGSPSSVMLRSALIQRHGFDGAAFPRHADSSACLEILRDADLGFVHKVLTYTRRPAEAQTSLSMTFNSYLAENLVALARYGPVFLSEAELARHYRTRLKRYNAFLAKSILRRRDSRFWDYHRRIAETLGLPLNVRRFVSGALWAVAEGAMSQASPLLRQLPLFRNPR